MAQEFQPLPPEALEKIPGDFFDDENPVVVKHRKGLFLLHLDSQGLTARRWKRTLAKALGDSVTLRLVDNAELAEWHEAYGQLLAEMPAEEPEPEPMPEPVPEQPRVVAMRPSEPEAPVPEPEDEPPPAANEVSGESEQAAETVEGLDPEAAEMLSMDLYGALPERARTVQGALPALLGSVIVILHDRESALAARRLQKACQAYLSLNAPPPRCAAPSEKITALAAAYQQAVATSTAEQAPAPAGSVAEDAATAGDEDAPPPAFDIVEDSVQRRILDADDYEKIPPGLRASETVVVVKENENDLVILHNPKALLAARRLQQACQTYLKMEASLSATEGLIIRSFRDAYALRADPESEEAIQRGSLEDEASKTDVGRTVKDIIQHAAALQATDVHIESRERPNQPESVAIRYRVSGDLTEGPMELSGPRGAQVANWLFSQGRRNNPQWVRHAMLDGVADVSIVDPLGGGMRQVQLRLANLPEIRGWDLVIRILNPGQNTITLEKLGYEPLQLDLLQEAFSRPYGIIVFSGPTGSGKSTSMLAALETLPANLKIVSLEQPVERPLHNTSHVTTADEAALARAIPSVNRWDGNVTVLGELRDQPSARALKDFTTSGKLTVITLHASNALTVPTRMAELSVEWSMLADPNFLVSLINQRLVPRLCPDCRQPLEQHWDKVPSYRRPDFEKLFGNGKGIFLRGEGCNRRGCRKGAIGRVLCAEVILVDDRDRTFIEKQSLREWRKDLLERGWMSITAHALQRARLGEIDPVGCEQAVGPLSGSVENIVDYASRLALLSKANKAAQTTAPN